LSIDVIERRRVVEERLRRARNLTQALDRATADLTSASGKTLAELDPEGSLQTAVATLAGVAALRPGFDIQVALPNTGFALRLRHLADDVDITLVRSETAPAPAVDPALTSKVPEPRVLSEQQAPTGSTGPAGEAGPDPAAEPAGDTGSQGHVASDLAAMLWRDVDPSPP
jgi:hypothetical protein